jgi:hypothetical protein
MCYRALLEHAAKDSVLVYSTLAFGARLAQETLNLRGVSVHLAPSIFFERIRPAEAHRDVHAPLAAALDQARDAQHRRANDD